MIEVPVSQNCREKFLKRLYIYQKERFPFLGNILLIGVFTFSAISYSRICRNIDSFIPIKTFLIGVFTTVTLFFLIRIFDEHKDRKEDAKYRKELPVPRGLISLRELRRIAIVIILLQLLLNAMFVPKMILPYFAVFIYLCLMGKEFFVSTWLKKNQLMYVFSHMLIVPLIDVYASALDWLQEGAYPPRGLFFFFGVSFMNGIVIEFGRKIRTTGQEKEGVITYSSLYGPDKACVYWITALLITLLLSMKSVLVAGYGKTELWMLTGFFFLCTIPAILFMFEKKEKYSRFIEYASALWTLAMYLTLGGVPMFFSLFFS